MADTEQGASNSTYNEGDLIVMCKTCSTLLWIADQRLLAAAREDNEEMLLEIFEQGGFDVNFQDGCVAL